MRSEEAVTGWRRERRRGFRRGSEGERENTAELCIVGDLREGVGDSVEWVGGLVGADDTNTLHEQLLQREASYVNIYIYI